MDGEDEKRRYNKKRKGEKRMIDSVSRCHCLRRSVRADIFSKHIDLPVLFLKQFVKSDKIRFFT